MKATTSNRVVYLNSKKAILAALLIAAIPAVQAADWSDTSLSYRYGSRFAEPYGASDITKNIVALTHASGYKYGSNFLNADVLFSDSKDPADPGSSSGAQEIYLVYRNTIDLGKVAGKEFKFGPVRGLGLTLGFDANNKDDAGYNSRKRMLVAGPTLMMDVPGFLNVSLLALRESNQPYNKFSGSGINGRYTYKTHAMLNAAWGIPFSIGSVGAGFEGYANLIDSKGRDEFGGATAVETNIDMQVMFDVGAAMGGAKNTFRAGLEYQYWKNKFGNPSSVPGSVARTPMVRIEYHF